MKFRLYIVLLTISTLIASCSGFSGENRKAEKQDKAFSRNVMSVVNRISSRSELITAETTVSKIMTAKDLQWYGDRKVVYSCTAYLKAGIDLSSFTPNSVSLDKETNTIVVTLPHAKLTSVDLRPENIQQEYFDKDFFRSDFTPEERRNIKVAAERDIRDHIEEYGVLSAAEDNARIIFKGIFKQVGVDNVFVQFK